MANFTDPLLNKAQAEAVYSAMCALNNVCGALLSVFIPTTEVYVQEDRAGRISVQGLVNGCPRTQDYATQADFAEAYEL